MRDTFRALQRGQSRTEILVGAGAIALVLLLVIPFFIRQRVLKSQENAAEVVGQLARLQDRRHLANNYRRYGTLEQVTSTENLPEDFPQALAMKLQTGLHKGYGYAIESGQGEDGATFVLQAWPAICRRTGLKSFYLDESGILRAGDAKGEPGTVELPAVESP